MTATLHHPRYRFDHPLATGGMGEVWVATDTLLDREVAVKLLRREYSQDPVLRARFTAEARNAASLQHPHVAAVFDYGEIPVEDGSPLPFLVMELVDGRPLSALLAGGQALAPEVAADLVAQAADGVAAAHRLGIVHRDVKPGNLLVTPDGQVKVTDFGVARALDAAPLTLTGHLIGTPHYLSPEQAQGATVTGASDIYALGIVLYQCLTGQPPFVGDTAVGTALMQIREPLPPFPDHVPRRLQQITRTATAKDPAERYVSMDALAAALCDETPATQAIAAASVPASVPAAAVGVAAGDATAPLSPAATGTPPGDDRRSRPVLRYALLGLLALLLAAGGVAALASRTDDPPATGSTTTRSPSADSSSPAGSPSAGSPAGSGVRVRAADYVGLPVEEAARRLDELGLTVRTRVRLNPGSEPAGTVAGIGPTGLLEPGSQVELSAWGPAPAPETTAPDSSGGTGGDEEGDGEGDGGADGGTDGGADGPGNSEGNGKPDKDKPDKGKSDKGKSGDNPGKGKGGKN